MGKLVPSSRAQAAFAAQPSTRFIVTLEAVRYQARLTWRKRTAAWYLDLWTQDGTAVALGRRLSPGFGPLLGTLQASTPAGILYVRGPDQHTQEMLGAELTLHYYTADEIPTRSSDTGLTVTVP